MAAPVALGLTRVTVAAPKRRIDVALPEHVPVGELLPAVLRHAGEGAADDGERHGGWVLRRATGTVLEAGRNLAAQGVRDGEALHLVPRRADWPELEYDDVVEVMASGARRFGRSWGGAATRRCALAVTAALLILGLTGVLVSRPPWLMPGAAALVTALVLLVAGTVCSRAMADALAGAVVAAAALPYAFAGGLIITVPDRLTLGKLGAPHLLLGSATLLVAALIGYFGVSAGARLFVAGGMTGLIGVISGLIAHAGQSAAGAAAVALAIVIGLMPAYPLLSIRMARLPVPELPRRPEEMLADKPVPPRSEVYAAMVRSDEALTGLLLGAAVVSAVAMAVLLASGAVTELVLTVAAVVALLLRARLFPTPRHRVPLIVSGLSGLALLAISAALAMRNTGLLLILLLVVVIIAGAVLTAGLIYSRRPPSPYLGRLADIADVLAIVALVPLACGVLGLYIVIQGVFASLGD